MVAKVAMVAIFPNVAGVGIEERVVTPAVRELDSGVASLCQCGLGLKEWFQGEPRKKQSDDREDRLCVKVNAHVSASMFPQIAGMHPNQHFSGQQHRIVVSAPILAVAGARWHGGRLAIRPWPTPSASTNGDSMRKICHFSSRRRAKGNPSRQTPNSRKVDG
jgi:hypothetical protein